MRSRRPSRWRTRNSRFPTSKSLSGRALRMLVVVGWVWMLSFIVVITWHLERNKQNRVDSPLEVNKMGDSVLLQREKGSLRHQSEPVKKISNLNSNTVQLPQSQNTEAYRSPLLIFTCQRANYLSQTLDDILVASSNYCGFGCPVVVSEDGSHEQIRQVIEEYTPRFRSRGISLIHINHERVDIDDSRVRRRRQRPALAYKALAQHYGWALSRVFDGFDPATPLPERVIILEEDIHTSPDFLTYMQATSKLLDEDSSLLAVSAFNDNGHLVKDSERLLRSDFFPGLGWMMTRKLWKDELEAKWPDGYWDDWLREPEQRKGRQIIRPEVSRTYHFGFEGGTSQNQFGSILERVKLNHELVQWSRQDLSYLHEPAYANQYGQLIAASTRVTSLQDALNTVKTSNARIEYRDFAEFQSIAEHLDFMKDEKATIPRTAYKGVVEIRPEHNHILFVTPPIEEMRRNFPSII